MHNVEIFPVILLYPHSGAPAKLIMLKMLINLALESVCSPYSLPFLFP